MVEVPAAPLKYLSHCLLLPRTHVSRKSDRSGARTQTQALQYGMQVSGNVTKLNIAPNLCFDEALSLGVFVLTAQSLF